MDAEGKSETLNWPELSRGTIMPAEPMAWMHARGVNVGEMEKSNLRVPSGVLPSTLACRSAALSSFLSVLSPFSMGELLWTGACCLLALLRRPSAGALSGSTEDISSESRRDSAVGLEMVEYEGETVVVVVV